MGKVSPAETTTFGYQLSTLTLICCSRHENGSDGERMVVRLEKHCFEVVWIEEILTEKVFTDVSQ